MKSLSIGSNISALIAQRYLARNSAELSSSLERLSSGARINRASDDAAGLSIAESLRSKTRLYTASIRNINDGISALGIVEGSLNQQTLILDRLAELAEQSANGTFTAEQRRSIGKEYRQLVAEFGRLGDTSSFNGIKLLEGTRFGGSSRITLQAGITGDQSSGISISKADTATLSGVLKVGNGITGIVESVTLNELTAMSGGAFLHQTVTDSSGKERDLLLTFEADSIGGGVIQYVAYAWQRVSDTGGVGAQTGSGHVVENASDEWVIGATSVVIASLATGKIETPQVAFSNFSFDQGAFSAAFSVNLAGLKFGSMPFGGVALGENTVLESTFIENPALSLQALDTIERRRADLSSTRSLLGSVESRLLAALAVNQTSGENASAAESRIRDVDIAAESARLTSSTILQKVAASVLRLASQQPQLALRLLSS